MRAMCTLSFWFWLATSSAGLAFAEPDQSTDDVERATDQVGFEDFSDLDLEALLDATVTTATKREQRIEEAPSVIDVITFYEIRRRGYRTVGEALRGIPGIAVIDDHLHWNVGVRGLYAGAGSASDIIKVMINGQPVSFRPTSANFFGHELIPIEAVKRIEVSRGPGSALYGANAFLGVIDVITFQGSDTAGQLGSEQSRALPDHALTLHGTYTRNEHIDTLNGGGSFLSAGQSGGFEYLASGTFNYANRSGLSIPGLEDLIRERLHAQQPDMFAPPQGYPSPGWDAPARARLLRGSPSDSDLERVGSFYGMASYALGGAGEVLLDTNLQYFDRYGEFVDFSHLTHENRLTYLNGYLRARYQLEPEEAGLSLKFSVALSGGMPTSGDHIADPLNQDFYSRRLFGYRALDVVLETSYAFSKDNVVTLGADYTNDFEDLLTLESVNERTGERYKQGFGEKTFVNLGIYAQWTWNPVKELGLTLGSRLDHNNVISCDSRQWDCIFSREDKVLPPAQSGEEERIATDRGFFQLSNRAAVVYAMPAVKMYAKAMYGSSFKPPSPFQLYHPPLTINGSVGNPDLKPQTADTLEFLLGSRPLKGFHLTADFFYTSVTDLVVTFMRSGGGAPEGRNADVSLYGLEGSASFGWKDRLSAFLNLTWIMDSALNPKRKDDESDTTWQHSVFNVTVPAGMFPSFLLSFGLNLHVPESQLNANLQVHYVGTRKASMLNNMMYRILSLQSTYSLDSYWLVDLTLSSVGLKLLGDNETVLTLSFRHVPGSYVEPGYGGVDIPALGPQVFLRMTQQF